MFPKNSAFSKTEEQEQYQEGVRQRALNSVREGRNELEALIKEAKELVDDLRNAQAADSDSPSPHKGRPRSQQARQRRPY